MEKKEKIKVKMQPESTETEEISQNEVLEYVNKLGLKNFHDVTITEDTRPGKKLLEKKKKGAQGVVERKEQQKKNVLSKNKISEDHQKNVISKNKIYEDQKKNAISKNKINEDQKKNVISKNKINEDQKKNGISKKRMNKGHRKEINGSQNEESRGLNVHQLIVRPNAKWFNLIEKKDELSEDIKPIPVAEVEGFRKGASQLLDKDAQVFKAGCLEGQQRSDFLWTEKIMKSGTLPDRMAGFTVKIQDSPIHNLYCIQQLISMAKVQGKQQCLIAADTIKDLFLEDLLPLNRKLVSFENRGSTLRSATPKQLIVWMFEDRLKSLYKQFLESMRRMASDNVDKLRGKAISIIHQLLAAHPEQENILLEMLVNKLGDPIKKVGSRALFHLNKLVEEHPRMKIVVIQEIERLLFRNNIGVKAQYYGICFLNSIRLDMEHPQISSKMINVYLAFFKGCVKTGDIDSKMMSGLLTGINKAYPSARQSGFQFRESMDTLFKIVQLSQFNISVHALCILNQLIDVNINQDVVDRFYRVLYRTLLNSEFVTTAHNMQFLNLVFKSMKKDTILNRVIAFTRRLLQICQNVQPNLACAILFLISEVSKTHEGNLVLGTISQDESLIKEPNSDGLSDDESSSETAVEIAKGRGKQKTSFDMANLIKSTNIQISDIDVGNQHDSKEKSVREIGSTISAPFISQPGDNVSPIEPKGEKDDRRRISYDPAARNPAFAGAELCIAYELTSLSNHYHPTVALYANTLARRKKISYDGNPLKDFTVSRFLDRFVYRNAKVKKNRPEYVPKGLRSMAVNSANYLQVEEEKVPEEEKFFYKYFKDKRRVPKDVEEEDSEVESVDDDEFDDFMGNYFKSGAKIEDSEDEDNVDFAAEVQSATNKRPKKREEDDSDTDDELEEEGSDDDFAESDDNVEGSVEFDNDDDDEDVLESDADMNADESEFQLDSPTGESEDDDDIEAIDDTYLKGKHNKISRKKEQDMFAPAEQFSNLLEENADEVLSGAQTLINRDKADKKQIKWEMERDRWVKGYKGSGKRRIKRLPNKKRKMM